MIQELSTALTFTKHLRDIQERIKDTEFKSVLADLQLALADVKVRCAELEEQKRQVESKCRDLEKRIAFKAELTFRAPLYYAERDATPFCPICWERDSRAIHLEGPHHYDDGQVSYNCQVCDKIIEVRGARPRQSSSENPGWLRDTD